MDGFPGLSVLKDRGEAAREGISEARASQCAAPEINFGLFKRRWRYLPSVWVTLRDDLVPVSRPRFAAAIAARNLRPLPNFAGLAMLLTSQIVRAARANAATSSATEGMSLHVIFAALGARPIGGMCPHGFSEF